MSWEEPEYDLLAAFQQRFGIGQKEANAPPDTKVLQSARHVNHNAIDVIVNTFGTKAAAETIWRLMEEKQYSTRTWSTHDLHPKAKDESTVNFIFTMDLLNFSFWSERDAESRYTVEYRGQRHTGYWSLVACLQRALDEGIPITSSDFWQDENECTEEKLRHVFRSATSEEIPLFEERLANLREAGKVLYKRFDCRPAILIDDAKKSAAKLVNLLAENFSSFRDETEFEDEKVRFLKRAQILVADLWACFEGQSYGEFHDIDTLTAFADYRVPQILNALGCMTYSPPLESRIQRKLPIETGHSWEVQLRGCSIWAVELIRKEIRQQHPDADVNAILIDFFLYDTVKEQEAAGQDLPPHHRTRSIWY